MHPNSTLLTSSSAVETTPVDEVDLATLIQRTLALPLPPPPTLSLLPQAPPPLVTEQTVWNQNLRTIALQIQEAAAARNKLIEQLLAQKREVTRPPVSALKKQKKCGKKKGQPSAHSSATVKSPWHMYLEDMDNRVRLLRLSGKVGFQCKLSLQLHQAVKIPLQGEHGKQTIQAALSGWLSVTLARHGFVTHVM